MIIGHSIIRARFEQLLRDQKFPQTSLFYGVNGSGKKMVARDIAQQLLVHDDNTRALFASGSHPDFFTVAPQAAKSQTAAKKSAAPGSIRAEQIQDLKKSLSFPPLLGDKQVVILDDAHRMTHVTANSLLKILEEPKPHQAFILITPSLHDILVTIRSRAARFFFAPLGVEEVQRIVAANWQGDAAIDAQKLAFLTRCFPGSPTLIGKTLTLDFSVAELADWGTGAKTLLSIREKILPRLDEDFDLTLFLQVLRQACLENVLQRSHPQFADLDFFDKIQNAERQLERHIPGEFVLENLFL